MGAPLAIRADLDAAELRRLARRERDGRATARPIAPADALGRDGPGGGGPLGRDGPGGGGPLGRDGPTDAAGLGDPPQRRSAPAAIRPSGDPPQRRSASAPRAWRACATSPGPAVIPGRARASERRRRPSCRAARIRSGTAYPPGASPTCAGPPRSASSASATAGAAARDAWPRRSARRGRRPGRATPRRTRPRRSGSEQGGQGRAGAARKRGRAAAAALRPPPR